MVEIPRQVIFPKRDGNRYRRIRRVPCGLVAIRQRRHYSYGFLWGDDHQHPIQWIEEKLYRRRLRRRGKQPGG